MPHRIRPAVPALFMLVLALWVSMPLAAGPARAQSADNPQDTGLDLSAAALFLEDLPPGFQSLPPADLERLDSALNIYRGMMSGQTQAGILNISGFLAGDAANRQIVIGGLIAPLSPSEQTQIDRALGNPESLIRQLQEQIGGDETAALPGYEAIGASGVAFSTTTGSYRLNYVVARRGPVVIEVVCLYGADQAPLVDVVALARLLDGRVSAVVGPETLRFRTAGPAVPELTTHIPTPLDLSTQPEVIGANLLLAALLMLLFAVAAELFTRVLTGTEGGIRQKLGGLHWLQALRRRLPVRQTGTGRPPLVGALRAAGVILFYGLVFSLLDRTWKPFSASGLVLLASMTAAYGLVGLLGDLRAWRVIRRWGLSAELNLRPTNLLLALASTATTRLLSLVPGLMFGTPEALQTDEGQFNEKQRGRLVRLGAGTFLSVALLAWLPTVVTTALQRIAIPESAKTVAGALEAFLLVIFAVALENLFVEMLGFPGSLGESLRRRRRWLWLLGLFLVTFAFYHTLINPRGELAGALQEADVRLFFGVAIAFIVVAFSLYLYTARGRRAGQAGVAAVPPTSAAAPAAVPGSPEESMAPRVPLLEGRSTAAFLSPAEAKECPACGQRIQAEARLCRFCRATFTVALRGYCLADHAVVDVVDGDRCSLCGGQVQDVHVESRLLQASAGGSVPTVRPVAAPAQAQAGTAAPGTTRPCPACGETIQAEARICRFCRQPVAGAAAAPPALTPAVAEPRAQTRRKRRWLLGGLVVILAAAAVAAVLWSAGGHPAAVPDLPATLVPTGLPLETPLAAPTAAATATAVAQDATATAPAAALTAIAMHATATAPALTPGAAPKPLSTEAATPIPSSPVPTQATQAPAGGPGNAEGRVLWNDQPMAGVTVKLCIEWSWFSGCQGQAYTAVSGRDGRYTLSSVPAAEYSFVTKLPDQEGETLWLGKIAVVAGETVTIRDTNVFKYDLRLTGPADRASVGAATPTLTWQAYPGASYYRVWVHRSAPSEAVVSFEEVSSPQYTFSAPLGPGEYSWSIDARNASRTQIAESETFYFTVVP